VNRVFILGPSHHQYLDNCALPDPNIKEYDTPFGPLKLDEDVLGELRGLSKASDSEFGRVFTKEQDEDEHSIEMQLPLIFHQLHHRLGVKDNLTIVPIIVGVLSPNVERVVGRLLAKYFKDPGTLFIISSDFCHWGLRFRYTQLQRDKTKFPKTMVFDSEEHPVNAGIEAMDREGMALIEKQDFEGFKRYLQMTGNTICGRHPISVLLEILRNVK
ncbi:Protein memo1, partial [Perkinsus olseni]